MWPRPVRFAQPRSGRYTCVALARGIAKSPPVMLSMTSRMRPAHERYAAAAKRVQRRITLALESGNYDQVRTLSATLQVLAKKAAEVKSGDPTNARPRRRRP